MKPDEINQIATAVFGSAASNHRKHITATWAEGAELILRERGTASEMGIKALGPILDMLGYLADALTAAEARITELERQ